MKPCAHEPPAVVELAFDPLISRHTSGRFCLTCGLRTGGDLIRSPALGQDRLRPDEIVAIRELRAASPGGWQDSTR